MSDQTHTPEKRFHGAPVSPGIAKGIAWVYHHEELVAPHYVIKAERVEEELRRFEDALLLTRGQIQQLQNRIAGSIGTEDAAVFDAHLLLVEDRMLIDEVVRSVKRDLVNVESVFAQVAGKYAKTLSEIDDPYLRERAVDIQDVSRRVMHNLLGRQQDLEADVSEPHIIVAHNLTPSDTAQFDRDLVLGMGMEIGSRTSHTAIMARSLKIPGVVGLHSITHEVATGDYVLLDGYNGLLICNPSKSTLEEYALIENERNQVERQLGSLRETECKTLDGSHIVLSANIEMPDDVPLVKESGAEGVGLFRTEFFYINRTELPSEEAQYQAYRSVSESLAPAPVIIRTLDLGGDKQMSALNLPEELNPFLGWRAIRYCLEELDVFKAQIRAILRASVLGNVRMMYPMISGVEEVRRANSILEECKAELRAEGKPFDENLEVGAMIEIPSAAISSDLIAREVDFFSIGTNDLIQYTIAVDRLNARIAHLYQPTHPAILRLIRTTVESARAHGIWVGVCGEMAGEVVLTPLLLGLGVTELSAGSAMVPRVKRAVQSLDMTVCRRLVEDVSGMDSAQKIYSACDAVARAHYADLL
jgi:phosphotransferase system enzyme I (PtsI)